MNVLVTGGAGYIGSHTCLELLNAGYGVIVIDNLCNSNPESLNRVEKLTGKKVKFYEGDVRDEALLNKIFDENEIGSRMTTNCIILREGMTIKQAMNELVRQAEEKATAPLQRHSGR